MNLLDIMKERHSVRQYTAQKIENEKCQELLNCMEQCNKQSGLHIQIFFNEPECFHTLMAHYGKFSGVTNYIALVGKKSAELEEMCGYYGEQLVLKAQEIGLNTCWVALTYGKGKCKAQVDKGEKLVCVIALGYGETQGIAHKSKKTADVCNYNDSMPEWFLKGVDAALLAPTAMNQQKFYFSLDGNTVTATAKKGIYTKLDLGIVKYHFETLSGHNI